LTIPTTKDLLRSQPAFGQLPSQVASGRGTDGSSILAHPVSQRRPSPPTIHARRPSPTIVTNLLRGLFGQAAPDDARRFDNSTASHAFVHPEILPYTLTMNDKKDRADFEHGNGARNKNLYTMIADMVNDTERNDEIGVLLDGDGEEGDDDFDIHINKLFKEGNINPRHFTTVSWEYVRGFASDLVNARKNVKKVSRKDELTQFSEWFLIVSFTP
jgi:hypothetical protein